MVLKGQTIYAGDPGATPLEIVLDTEDGTVLVCDLLFTAKKSEPSQKRGEVAYQRRRAISQRIIQGLAIAARLSAPGAGIASPVALRKARGQN